MLAAAAAVAVGGLCIASAFDRANAVDILHRDTYDFDLGVGSTRRSVAALLATGDNKQAEAKARQLVARDPVGDQSLALLGATQLVNGDAQGSYNTFMVAGRLGWRNPTTQIYLLSTAISVGDSNVAAQRLDALQRAWPKYKDVADRAITYFEGSEEGRKAIAERLAYNPAWKDDYLMSMADAAAPRIELRVLTLRAAQAKGMTISTRSLARVLRKISNRGDPVLAGRIAASLGEADFNVPVRNAGFEAPAKDADHSSPFDWSIRSNADASAQVEDLPDASQGHALRIDMAGSVRALVAQQVILLPAGKYRASWRTPGATPAMSSLIQLQLACAPSGQTLPNEPAKQDGDVAFIGFTVPEGCSAEFLKIIAIAPDWQVRQPLWVDDIAIKKM